jgi:glucokinase
MVAGAPEAVTAPLIYRAAQQGDPLCRELLRLAAEALGTGLANLVNIFNPQLIVLGGGLSQMDDLFIQPALRIARGRAMPLAAGAVRFEVGQLGDDAGLVGALLLLRERLDMGSAGQARAV